MTGHLPACAEAQWRYRLGRPRGAALSSGNATQNRWCGPLCAAGSWPGQGCRKPRQVDCRVPLRPAGRSISTGQCWLLVLRLLAFRFLALVPSLGHGLAPLGNAADKPHANWIGFYTRGWPQVDPPFEFGVYRKYQRERPVSDAVRESGGSTRVRGGQGMAGKRSFGGKVRAAVNDGAEMNLIWRFYMDQERQWRWQQLSVGSAVVAESPGGYKEYEGCVANARGQGYVFLPPKTTRVQAQLRGRRKS
jgi:hypothetical protein